VTSIAIDHPDEVIHWFADYPEAERARRPVGDCPHDCEHWMTAVVGWGPDLKHYELVRCDVKDGCNKNCRGWMAAAGASSYELHRRIEWKLLDELPPEHLRR
jgi:hypothetical protein